MTITLQPRWDEVDTTDSATEAEQGATLYYLAFTTAGESEAAVRSYAKSNVPDAYDGLIFTKVNVKRHQDSDDVWACTAHYESAASPFTQPALAVDEVRWSVRNSGNSTLKRAYSRGLVSEVVDPANASKFQFTGTVAEKVVGIKLGENGGFEATGLDYSLGSVEISVETVKDATAISGGYVVTAATHAEQNAVNSATWRGFAAGTCRLVSYSASERSGTTPEWDVSYSIVFSPNLSNIEVGADVPTVASKKGHQVLDVLYIKKDISGVSLSIPIRAAVHDWYPEIDFNAVLGI